MAKLHNYYVLCPLIDQKSFLGVAQDENDKHVIITLGRNVVNKYRLTDQKQVSGWTSKDHITSPVIYDTSQSSYVGVFNNNTIKTWETNSANLDKLKKYKFSINILQLLVRAKKPPLIIFTNGSCASLPYAIENRKTFESKSFLKDTDTIVDCGWSKTHNTEYICYVLKTAHGYEILTCPIREELGDMEKSKVSRIKITRSEDVEIVGIHLSMLSKTSKSNKSEMCIFVLWSDSKMSKYNIMSKEWKKIGTVPWITTKPGVSMTCIGLNHLIIFGSNKDEDGAILVAYNYALGVGSCKYPMKMHRADAKIYFFNSTIILEASNHIGMLPLTLEEHRNLSSLLGSDVIQNESTEIANWDTPTEPVFNFSPEMREAVTLGISERAACAKVVPDLIEKKDTATLLRIVSDFKDIPEPVIAMLTRYVLRTVNEENLEALYIAKAFEDNFKDKTQELDLLNEVFKIEFCDAIMIPHLRGNLDVTSSLFLIRYIMYLLFDSLLPLEPEYERKLFDWCSLILDSFYQLYVLSPSKYVTSTLAHFQIKLVDLVNQLKVASHMIVTLNDVLHTPQSAPKQQGSSMSYSIEIMNL